MPSAGGRETPPPAFDLYLHRSRIPEAVHIVLLDGYFELRSVQRRFQDVEESATAHIPRYSLLYPVALYLVASGELDQAEDGE